MKKRTIVSGLLVLCLAGSLAWAKRVEDFVEMRIEQAAICSGLKKVEGITVPKDPGTFFSTRVRKLVSYIRFRHVMKRHTLQWKWYTPSDKLYVQSSEIDVVPTGKYHDFVTGAHEIVIRGETAMLSPGGWRVVIFRDGTMVKTLRFTLSSREGGAE